MEHSAEPRHAPGVLERPWIVHYPPGVGPDGPALRFETLGEMVEASAARWGERPACTVVLPNAMEASLSFGEVAELARAFAAYLRGALGVAEGDRVALLLPNTPAYAVCAFGVLEAGAVLVNVNPLYTERELEGVLADSGARVVVALDRLSGGLARVATAAGVRSVVVARIGDFFPPVRRTLIQARLRLSGGMPRLRVPHVGLAAALREGARLAARGTPLPRITASDLALLQYTGGTTGKSKGAMLTHRNLLANLAQIDDITRGYLRHGEEVLLTVLPLYHIFAFSLNLCFGFYSGSHDVLVPNPRPLRNLEPAFARHAVTWSTAVSTLLRGLLDEPWFQRRPPRLHSVYAGGGATPPAVLEAFERLTGSTVVEGYGMSECSPLVTFNPVVAERGQVRRSMPQVGGVGLPLPGTEVRLMGGDGEPVAAGEPGEILVRGPQVMRGYWRQPAETEQALRDGWLHTGDIGRFDDDGYLSITDRKKDMIIVSGFNVYPTEVEACIAGHPDVADVAVVGIPDDTTGEAVRAYVVPRGDGISVESVRNHCRRLMAAYKIPRTVRFVGELPKNPLGKTLRRELRAMALAGQD